MMDKTSNSCWKMNENEKKTKILIHQLFFKHFFPPIDIFIEVFSTILRFFHWSTTKKRIRNFFPVFPCRCFFLHWNHIKIRSEWIHIDQQIQSNVLSVDPCWFCVFDEKLNCHILRFYPLLGVKFCVLVKNMCVILNDQKDWNIKN